MLNREGENAVSVSDLFQSRTEAEMQAKMRSMGAINLDAPLPHSKYIKVLKSGRVFPWNELLAGQPHSEVACCDESGNTDPAAWEADVRENSGGEPDVDAISLQARIAAMANQAHAGFEHGKTMGDTPQNPNPYPEGVVSYQNADSLIAQLI